MNQVFVSSVTVIDDGDEKSWRYGVNEISTLDAEGTLRRYLAEKGMEYAKMETRLATRGEAASLNLSAGCVGLLN